MKDEPFVRALKAENARLKEDNLAMRNRIKWLERKVFGSTSDKRTETPSDDADAGAGSDVVQMTLFDDDYLKAYEESQAVADEQAKIIQADQERRKAEIKKKRNRAPRSPRAPKWENLERRDTYLHPADVDIDQCVCIGDDTVEILHREPAKFWVEVQHRPKYILRSEMGKDEIKVHQAKAPVAAIPGNHVAADVLAWFIVNKFQWSLPEYRQSAMLKQQGVILPTSTINDWMHACADKLYLLYLRLKQRIMDQSDYVQADEVPFNIADRKGSVRKGYAWQVNDCSGKHLGRYFFYEKGSREKSVPQGLFVGFHGAVQVDGYGGYDFLDLCPDITLLGCLAHVRRKFTDAEREDPLAKYPLDQIELLYELERQFKWRNATPAQIETERREKAAPILDALDKWMEMIQSEVTPKSLLGIAIRYAYRMMPRLRRYWLDGRYQIDNNTCEQGNRTPVLGRKNYLFSANDEYAQDNTVFYSLIETCVDLGVNPLDWLAKVLSLPLLEMSDEELDRLLPQYQPDPDRPINPDQPINPAPSEKVR